MSLRMLRRAAALFAIGALAALLAPGAAAGAAPAQAPTQAADPATAAAAGYGGCLASRKSGDLLILIDESGSLKDSDPANARVAAANYLVGRLSDFTQQRGVDLDVAIAAFKDDFTLATGWTRLGPSTLPALTAGVDAFRDRVRGIETDYWSAMEGARRALGDRATPGLEGPPCQAIAWFSDGKLDVVPRDTDDKRSRYGTTKPYAEGVDITSEATATAAEDAARTDLCRDGGLADGLRASGIVTFAVGLTAPGQATEADFGLMRSIATGTPGNAGPCGKLTEPSPGTFQLASNLDELLRAFDNFPDPPLPPGPPTPICQVPAAQCDDRHQFVLDGSIEAVHILGSTDRDGIAALMVLPDGSDVPLEATTTGPAQVVRDGVTISYTWLTPRTVEIDLTTAPAAALWSGVWSLVFVDPAGKSPDGTSNSNIKIWSNLQPAWLNSGGVELSSESVASGVELGLVKATDQNAKVDPQSLLGEISLDAVLVGADRTETPVAEDLDKTQLAGPVELDLSTVAPGAATLRLTLDLTTKAARASDGTQVPGTQLQPQTVEVPVQVAPPRGYPVVAGPVNFGIADGTTTLTATLPITGPGCVWVDPGAPLSIGSSPGGGAGIAITAPGAVSGEACVVVPEGQQGSLALTLAADRVANGTVTGTVPVSIAPLGQPAESRTVDVAFTADLRKPFQTLNFLAALIAALLLGPGIPLALLYGAKWLTARIPDRSLSARQIPVTVDSGRVLRDNGPFEVRPDDFVQLVSIPPGGARRIDLGGVELKTRIGRSPLGAGFVTVSVPGTAVVAASSKNPPSYGKSLHGLLPLAVHNTWVVLHDPAGPPEQATVLMLVGGDTVAGQRRDLGADVAARLPDVLGRLRQAAQQRGMVAPAAPVAAGVGGGPGPVGAAPGGWGGPDPFAPTAVGPPPTGPPLGAPPGTGPDPYGRAPGPGPAGGARPGPDPYGPDDPFGPGPGRAGP